MLKVSLVVLAAATVLIIVVVVRGEQDPDLASSASPPSPVETQPTPAVPPSHEVVTAPREIVVAEVRQRLAQLRVENAGISFLHVRLEEGAARGQAGSVYGQLLTVPELMNLPIEHELSPLNRLVRVTVQYQLSAAPGITPTQAKRKPFTRT